MTDEQILAIAHRQASVYRHRSDPDSPSYGFVNHTLLDFARELLAAAPQASALPLPEGWQPIGTRPMDGARYLAVTAHGTVRLVRQADPYDRLPLMDTPEPWPDLPTHWMPLPAAPLLVQPEGLRVRVIELSDDQRQSLTSTATHIPGISEDTKQ